MVEKGYPGNCVKAVTCSLRPQEGTATKTVRAGCLRKFKTVRRGGEFMLFDLVFLPKVTVSETFYILLVTSPTHPQQPQRWETLDLFQGHARTRHCRSKYAWIRCQRVNRYDSGVPESHYIYNIYYN